MQLIITLPTTIVQVLPIARALMEYMKALHNINRGYIQKIFHFQHAPSHIVGNETTYHLVACVVAFFQERIVNLYLIMCERMNPFLDENDINRLHVFEDALLDDTICN